MITIEDITRIAKTGEKIKEGDYIIEVLKHSEGWDAAYWCLDMHKPGSGGVLSPFTRRLTEKTKQRMVDVIYENIERWKNL